MSIAAQLSGHANPAPSRAATNFGSRQHPLRAEALAAAGGGVTMFAVGASLVTNTDTGTASSSTAPLYLGVWLLLAVAGLLTALVGAAGVRSYRGIRFQIAAAGVVLTGGVIYLIVNPSQAFTGAGVGLLFGIAWIATLIAFQVLGIASRRLHKRRQPV